MTTVAGLVFSNIHDRNVPELTQKRTMASVPFGGRYRLVDFTLSNMVNADIYKVGIITHYNYQSLVDHLEAGKDWDLARRSGGLKILPPYITAYDNTTMSTQPYSSRLEALMGAYNFVSKSKEEYIVLCDSDVVCNFDLKDMIKSHKKSGADITIAYKNGPLPKNNRDIMSLQLEGERITKISLPDQAEKICNFSLDIVIIFITCFDKGYILCYNLKKSNVRS